MLKDLLFSGDISYEIFMNEYYQKKPCILGLENGPLAGHNDSGDVERILENTISIDHHSDQIILFNNMNEDPLKVMDLFTKSNMMVPIILNEEKFQPTIIAHMVRKLLENGGVIKVRLSHNCDKKIARTKNKLEHIFKAQFSSALFYHYTGTKKEYFTDEHFDVTDLFVFQMKGKKEWSIREPVIKYPVGEFHEEWRGGDTYSEEVNKSEKPICLDIVLKEGEVLYLPRGYGHTVSPCGGESLHVTFDMLPITFHHFKKWKRQQHGDRRDMELKTLNIQDFDFSNEDISQYQSDVTLEEFEEFKRYVENGSFSNASEGFIPTESVEKRISENENIVIDYCPIYKARFVEKDECIQLSVNTELFELEHDKARYFKQVLNYLFEKKSSLFVDLLRLKEMDDKNILIDVIQDLYDNGIININ
jgi:ribosomal protein L16 Arg81 hydroxylase